MARLLSALTAGILFGLGLTVSGMVNPAKVVGFLDLAGNWDPTLAVVMIGALAVAAPTFRLILKRPYPLLAPVFSLPSRTDLDARLLCGAALFGIGWGLVGLCPGPALAALVTGSSSVLIFVGAMLAGVIGYKWLAG